MLKNSTVAKRVDDLRSLMKEESLSYYIITGTDAHGSEYVASHWRTRAFITGFTGSAGTVLIGEEGAWLWADSRYFIQAAAELEGTGITLMKIGEEGVPTLEDFLLASAKKGEKIGACATTISIKDYKKAKEVYERAGLSFVLTDDLLSPIWTDRPPIPSSPLYTVDPSLAGESVEEKIAKVRAELAKAGADYTLIASIDDIAWLTNLRASDIPCNPVFYSFMYISQEKAILYTSKERKLPAECKGIEHRDYEEIYKDAEELCQGVGYYSDERLSAAFLSTLDRKENLTGRDFTTDLKARKNESELKGERRAHFLDGVAFINAFSQVDFSKTDGTYSEIAISTIFEDERKKAEEYIEASFTPISGFGEHGAMCHYSASEESNASIDKDGLLVLDTGGQYRCGTTDLTRTLLFGDASEEEKKDYTLVLKGHLALSRAKFIQGTRGYQLDVLAKMFMWQEGMSFYHGTGHGVGCLLNVHEGPMRISAAPIEVALDEGMVVSDEPGIYKEGRHGIRIENLIAVRKAEKTEFGQFMDFEVLSLVPYERRLIDLSLLTEEEIAQIDAYHKRVHDELEKHVRKEALSYLEMMTAPLGVQCVRC